MGKATSGMERVLSRVCGPVRGPRTWTASFPPPSKALAPPGVETLGKKAERLYEIGSPRRAFESDGCTVRAVHGCHQVPGRYADLVADPRLLVPARQIVGGDVYVHQSKINAKRAISDGIWPSGKTDVRALPLPAGTRPPRGWRTPLHPGEPACRSVGRCPRCAGGPRVPGRQPVRAGRHPLDPDPPAPADPDGTKECLLMMALNSRRKRFRVPSEGPNVFRCKCSKNENGVFHDRSECRSQQYAIRCRSRHR
jgi:hypothetical protein